jgi:uncharacterized iron-regulated membrane protein
LENPKRKNQAKTLRLFRKIHRIVGISLFFLFFFISITGILLGWKKHSGELLLAKSHQGTTANLRNWMSIDSLNNIASNILHDSISSDLSTQIDRIDIRKEKGMVKFIYENHYWGIQLDGATGKLLNISTRRSDFIENIHDGSIFDTYLGTSNGQIKLVYTSIMGLALLTFTITGFWLWYGPKRIRQKGRGHL